MYKRVVEGFQLKSKFPTLYTQTLPLVPFFYGFHPEPLRQQVQRGVVEPDAHYRRRRVVAVQVNACDGLLCKQPVEEVVERPYPHSCAS